ncbi:MAG: A24 family peptidase [Halocynthiibacter sp.]
MTPDLYFFVPTVLIGIWVALSDLKTMRIPNVAVIALMVAFMAIAVFTLPWDVIGTRWIQFAVVLGIGFLLTFTGQVGAGDVKYVAAMALYIDRSEISTLIFISPFIIIGALVFHRLMKRISFVRNRTANWQSWEENLVFPMGFTLAILFITHLYLTLGTSAA